MSTNPGLFGLFYWQEFILPVTVLFLTLVILLIAKCYDRRTLQWIASAILLLTFFGSVVYILNAIVYSTETVQGQLFKGSVYLSVGKIAFSIGFLLESTIILLLLTAIREQSNVIPGIDATEEFKIGLVELCLSIILGVVVICLTNWVAPIFSFFGTLSNSEVSQLIVPALSVVVGVSIVRLSIYGYRGYAGAPGKKQDNNNL